MILTIQNKNITIDNNKIMISYVDVKDVSIKEQQNSRISQKVGLRIENNEFKANYLSNIWESDIKDLEFDGYDNTIEVQLVDDDENTKFTMENVNKIDYQISVIHGTIQEIICFYIQSV